jgi:excisionase family DNA binding protein
MPDECIALSERDVARRLGVSHATIRRQIERGELRAVKVGKRTTRVLLDDLDEYLRRRTVPAKQAS